MDADKEEEKHEDAAAAEPHHARQLVPGAHSPLEDQEVAPAKEHEEPEPHHPRQLVPGAHSPLEDQDASAPPEKPIATTCFKSTSHFWAMHVRKSS